MTGSLSEGMTLRHCHPGGKYNTKLSDVPIPTYKEFYTGNIISKREENIQYDTEY